MKYRPKNTAEIEAVQWTGTGKSYAEVCAFMRTRYLQRVRDNALLIGEGKNAQCVLVAEFIVKGKSFYPIMNASTFHAKYEQVRRQNVPRSERRHFSRDGGRDERLDIGV